MGRAGRYTLAVMAWVAAYALWSGLLGLVVAAVTGERLGVGDAVQAEVPAAVSALFFVLLPAPPTVVALWFNDWARDGFPSRADRAARRAQPAAGLEAAVDPEPAAAPEPAPASAPAPAPATSAPASPLAAAPEPAPVAAAPDPPRVVAPPPLGVPVRDVPQDGAGFPVAPLLRD